MQTSRDFELTSVADAPCNAKQGGAPSQSRGEEDKFKGTEPVGLRGNECVHGPHERDGFVIQTKTLYPSQDVMLTIYKDGKSIHWQRVDRYVWAGHCSGLIIINRQIERLKAQAAECEACQRGGEAETPILPLSDKE